MSLHDRPELCGDNAAPYVLSALTEEEEQAFRLHLESCAVCREEVAALRVVASALPAAAPQLNAPPVLKQRVMASIHEELGALDAEPARSRRSAFAWPRWRPVFAPALGAIAVVIVLAVIVLSSGGAGGARVIHAEVIPQHASASLRISGGHAQLDISDLPQTPAQRVYEVWVKRSGAAQPTDALFTVTAAGDATVGVPGSVAGVEVIMVTSEPLGGSKVPTSSPVIVAHLS